MLYNDQLITFENKCWFTVHLYNHVPIIYAKSGKFGIRNMKGNYLNFPSGFRVPQKL